MLEELIPTKEIFIQQSILYGQRILTALVVIVVAYFLIKIIDSVIRKLFEKTPFDRSLEVFIEKLVVTVLWIVTFVIILGLMGVNVSAIVASLGIAGFVVGFALKDTLGNLAAGVMLLFYKPFKLGDYITSGGHSGTVKSISVSACTLKTGDNQNIIIPNAVLWGQPLINFDANKKRRIDITLGVGYKDNLDKVMKVISQVIQKDKRILKDPTALIAVRGLGESSVNLVIRPWVNTNEYWDVHDSLTKALKEACDKYKIEIPFPQSVVHMKR